VRLIPAAVCVVLLAVAGDAAEGPPADWSRVAELVVGRSLKLAPGEKVVLFWERSEDRGAAAARRKAIAAKGGVVAGEIDAAEPRNDEAWRGLFAAADVAIWLPTKTRFEDRPFEHLVEGSRVRSIHFHWFLPPDAADAARIEAMYAEAIAVSPEDLLARQSRLEGRLRGAKVRVTSPNGTDLRFEIPADARFHRNTGDANPAKVKDARSVRDREEELPASVLRTTALGAAQGTLVGYAGFDTRGPILAATFADGQVQKLESRREAGETVKKWEAAGGDKRRPAEFVISANPALIPTLPSGFMPYYGYGSGIVRVAIGDNWESGGSNRSELGEILFFLVDATVEANGTAIVKDGRLVEP
jgi:hypothetical protein